MTKETRNSKLLAEFTEYCKANPEQRFWQALRNWAGLEFLVAAHGGFKNGRDTFHWENRND